MHLHPNAHRRIDEYRRYFPDWTHRSLQVGAEIEADHNSYLAGGYAEEFGYFAQLDVTRGVPEFNGESPDDCSARLVQGAAMHPGYPLEAYPVELASEEGGGRNVISAPSTAVSHPGETEATDHGRFFRVTERLYESEHRRLAHRAAAAVTRLLATLMALRWDHPSLR